MSAKVLRWAIPIDDQPHEIGGGQVLHVGQKPTDPNDQVNVWTLELPATPAVTRRVQVYGTGQPVPAQHSPLGSVIAGYLVWHVFEVRDGGSDV